MRNLKNNSYLLFFFFFLLAFSGNISAQQKKEINFNKGNYQEILAKAKANHKKIFVDAYATWCGPCKELQRTTFKDPKAANYFNKNFVNMSIDVEKGEGVKLTKKWGITGLPTLIILDENGKVIDSHVGYVDGNGLIEFAKETTGM